MGHENAAIGGVGHSSYLASKRLDEEIAQEFGDFDENNDTEESDSDSEFEPAVRSKRAKLNTNSAAAVKPAQRLRYR